jgi:uncharacterized radical SAM superfamily Fe-S cluster-containing enzyme
MPVRDYTYRGTTRSLCPQCRRVVDAKIVVRGRAVWFRKRCPEHGEFEDFVCSDVAYFDRHELDQPARLPTGYGVEAERGCPYDCGLCEEHEQHTCVALIEVTTGCNLKCPLCFAESGPGGTHVDFETFTRMVDRVVDLEGIADIVQISGGEPTLHPELVRMVRYAYEQPIQAVMINTNGIRLAKDRELLDGLAAMRDRLEIYLQFDGFDPHTHRALRGEELLEVKLAALERLREYDIRSTLVCTVDSAVNPHEVGAVLRFGLEREELARRATMPDLVKGLVAQSGGLLAETDFYPLPCAHPNCHQMAYLYRGGGEPIPVSRLIDVPSHVDQIANSIVYTPARARQIVARALDATGACGCGPDGCSPTGAGREFVEQALAERLTGADVFRVTLTSFLDAHTFDTRQVMKCCLAHVLPSGHVVPFCTYNTLYRDGHLPLPPLKNRPPARPAPKSFSLSVLS